MELLVIVLFCSVLVALWIGIRMLARTNRLTDGARYPKMQAENECWIPREENRRRWGSLEEWEGWVAPHRAVSPLRPGDEVAGPREFQEAFGHRWCPSWGRVMYHWGARACAGCLGRGWIMGPVPSPRPGFDGYVIIEQRCRHCRSTGLDQQAWRADVASQLGQEEGARMARAREREARRPKPGSTPTSWGSPGPGSGGLR